MNLEYRKNKQAIRSFMQNHYSDERLTALLAHAKDGKLVFASCCCFVGAATADHALRGRTNDFEYQSHYKNAQRLEGAFAAEVGYYALGPEDESLRLRILIPIIRAEMKRRDASRKQIEWKQELVEMST